MSYTVGIVGATGAVGKEIRQCLEKRDFPVSKLRIFGSERSAGKTIDTEKYGSVQVELFDVNKARECDVVFLAVSGDFALEHAKALSEGDGCVVIDNSVGIFVDVYWNPILRTTQSSHHNPYIVGLSLRKGRSIGGPGNQRKRDQEKQTYCKPQLHDGDWTHGALALAQALWSEKDYHEYLSGCFGSRSTWYG